MARIALVGTSVSSCTRQDWLCVPPCGGYYISGLAPEHPSSYPESCWGPDVVQTCIADPSQSRLLVSRGKSHPQWTGWFDPANSVKAGASTVVASCPMPRVDPVGTVAPFMETRSLCQVVWLPRVPTPRLYVPEEIQGNPLVHAGELRLSPANPSTATAGLCAVAAMYLPCPRTLMIPKQKTAAKQRNDDGLLTMDTVALHNSL